MQIDWPKLALLALQLAVDFSRWVEREKITAEAERKIVVKALEDINASIDKARQARASVHADIADDPGRLRKRDRHLRDDDEAG